MAPVTPLFQYTGSWKFFPAPEEVGNREGFPETVLAATGREGKTLMVLAPAMGLEPKVRDAAPDWVDVDCPNIGMAFAIAEKIWSGDVAVMVIPSHADLDLLEECKNLLRKEENPFADLPRKELITVRTEEVTLVD